MGFFDKLFGGNKQPDKKAEQELAQAMTAASEIELQAAALEKENLPELTDQEAMTLFMKYNSPATKLLDQPGGPKFNAYFSVVNAAKFELVKNAALFEKATKRKVAELVEHINNPKPAISNMIICGMIFRMGEYAVIKSRVFCVDFCEKIPNCIALYMFLIGQQEPGKQIIDAGDNSDHTALSKAMNTLKILDSNWSFEIH